LKQIILSVAALALVTACETSSGDYTQESKADIQLYAMNCGHISSPDFAIFGSEGEYDGKAAELAVMCFLIRHPAGDFLWDTGMADALNALPDGQVIDGGAVLTVPVTLESQINSLGLNFEDIEYFSVSHAHFDHVGNVGKLTNSTLLVQEAEYDHMFAEGEAVFVNRDLLAPLKNNKTVKFTGDHDVFGDGRVVITSAPGHTPGHSVLFVDLANEGPVYLTGDLFHQERSRTEKIVPVINFSKPQTLASIELFEANVTARNARVIIQHSVEEQERLPTLPAFLD